MKRVRMLLIWMLILGRPVLAQTDVTQLISPELKEVAIVNHIHQPELNITYLTLANGVRIALRLMVGKEGSFVDSSVYIRAESLNRQGQYTGHDNVNAQIGGYLMRYAGVANLNHQQFNQFLKEHKTHFESNGSHLSVGIDLKTDPSHVKAALQAIYAFYTKPRSDRSVIRFALDELIKRYQQQQPDTSLESITSDSLRQVLSRKGSYLNAASLQKANPRRAVNLAKERFASAQDFVFTIVGPCSPEEIIPLLQRYLGNLPTSKTSNRPKVDDDGSFPDPQLKRTIYLPNASTAVIERVFLTTYAQVEAGQNNLDQAYVSYLSSRIKQQLAKTPHPEERVLVLKQPGEILNMTSFKNRKVGVLVKLYCLPERIDTLSGLIRSEMDRLAREPVAETELASFRQRGKKNNSYMQTSSYTWSLLMWGSSFRPEWPIRAAGERERLLENITAESLQRTAQRYAATKDIIELTFLPASTR